MRVLGIH